MRLAVVLAKLCATESPTITPAFQAIPNGCLHGTAAPGPCEKCGLTDRNSGCLICDLEAPAVVFFNNRTHLNGGDARVLDDDPSVDNGVLSLLWRTENGGRNRIGECAGVIDRVQVDAEKICAFSRFQGTDIGPAKNF